MLESGEVLILPAGWWHQTVMLEDSISITHDLVNASNGRSYMHALAVESAVDPKVASFHEESKPYLATWRDRLPVRKTREIRRVDGRDLAFEDFLRDFLIPREPVVIENLIDDWPALSKWNMDYLKTHYGRVFIQYFKSRDDRNKRMRIRNFLETDFGAPHYAMWCLNDFYDVLRRDFHKIHLLDDNQKDWTLDLPPKEQSELTWIFMGLKGSGIGTHMDRLGQHVCSAQIFGRKTRNGFTMAR
uniref:Cupin-like domain-containing protein n=1 Tax=Candidatus Kentrum sp. LPFa TaxID=2126335 RepID=A0A450X8E5_9GAMM|nr:MAG: Cupin-like domain-containing protein [Candidatus Kentron sp. LPFa]VFK25582.1 MAG: Cupin-like domain-containing protein [Candidatus Kentron sp. LPFa]